MQIYTVEDADFPTLWSEFLSSREIGRYRRDGRLHIVRAAKRFMFISDGDLPGKLALKPARSLDEALRLAERCLKRERERGSEVQQHVAAV